MAVRAPTTHASGLVDVPSIFPQPRATLSWLVRTRWPTQSGKQAAVLRGRDASTRSTPSAGSTPARRASYLRSATDSCRARRARSTAAHATVPSRRHPRDTSHERVEQPRLDSRGVDGSGVAPRCVPAELGDRAAARRALQEARAAAGTARRRPRSSRAPRRARRRASTARPGRRRNCSTTQRRSSRSKRSSPTASTSSSASASSAIAVVTIPW